MSEVKCPCCNGDRFIPRILDVTFKGLNISQLSSKTISSAIVYFNNIRTSLTGVILSRSEQIISQIIAKLETLEKIGLGYLSIDRPTSTLSGGEAQRLRIATQLVSDLCGLTYVLDEPTVGLHSHDTQNLINAINNLKDNGNTIILVEHDPEIISAADHIIDLGPGAGENGGVIIGQGNLCEITGNPKSVTGKYLAGHNMFVPIKKRELKPSINIEGATANNLKNFNISIPTGGIVSITGVSGSGKTSLAFDVIAESFKAGRARNCRDISYNNIGNILVVDQQKIGTSQLSTSATYTGLFELIRELFATLYESKLQGLKKSHFSFNSKEGRCPTCKGMGNVKVSMDFLSDVWVNCDTCNGKRYKESVLEILMDGHNINDILNLSITEACTFFKHHSKINKILSVLKEIGLGYIKLGQPTNTFSGGETQRLKLASELIKESTHNCLIIFDEPSTGLHMQDVEKLIGVFNDLVDNGNTVLVVEHNLDIIKNSDWIIDLGPDGGDKGGEIIYSGIPSEITICKQSYTGKALYT